LASTLASTLASKLAPSSVAGCASWAEAFSERPAFGLRSFIAEGPPPVRPRALGGPGRGVQSASCHAPTVKRDWPVAAVSDPGQIQVLDRYGDLRAVITKQGEVIGRGGILVGHLNLDEMTAGSCHDEYLGCAQDQLSGDEVAILDAAEALDDLGMSPGNQAGSPLSKPSAASVCLCAVLHLGSGLLKDGPAGRLVAELKRDGTLLSAMGSGLGCFRPFSFKDAKAAALYLALLDPGMTSAVEESPGA